MQSAQRPMITSRVAREWLFHSGLRTAGRKPILTSGVRQGEGRRTQKLLWDSGEEGESSHCSVMEPEEKDP